MKPFQIKNIDKEAVSLSIILKKNINRDDFLKCYVDKFFDEYLKFVNFGFSSIYEEYKENFAYLAGDKVFVIDNLGETIEGKYKDIDKEGHLVLNTDFGDKIINVGDVFNKIKS